MFPMIGAPLINNTENYNKPFQQLLNLQNEISKFCKFKVRVYYSTGVIQRKSMQRHFHKINFQLWFNNIDFNLGILPFMSIF